MTASTEPQRVSAYVGGEAPPPVCVRVVGRCPAGAAESLERVKEVMRVVAAQAHDRWPQERRWRQLLPTWFVELFENLSLDEILADESLWHFESWLEAMRLRGWEWWSSKLEDEVTWKVFLTAFEWPYRVGPLEYLAKVSGASELEIEES